MVSTGTVANWQRGEPGEPWPCIAHAPQAAAGAGPLNGPWYRVANIRRRLIDLRSELSPQWTAAGNSKFCLYLSLTENYYSRLSDVVWYSPNQPLSSCASSVAALPQRSTMSYAATQHLV